MHTMNRRTRTLSRDPFARTEHHRRVAHSRDVHTRNAATCQWCGVSNEQRTLYYHETHHDSGRITQHAGVFCSVGCHASYHN